MRALRKLRALLFLPAIVACDASIDGQGVAPLAVDEAPDPGMGRCPQCGWIESKREIVPEVADSRAPQVYEYTIRHADGSSSVFREALPATWRLRERVVVIEGTAGDVR